MRAFKAAQAQTQAAEMNSAEIKAAEKTLQDAEKTLQDAEKALQAAEKVFKAAEEEVFTARNAVEAAKRSLRDVTDRVLAKAMENIRDQFSRQVAEKATLKDARPQWFSDLALQAQQVSSDRVARLSKVQPSSGDIDDVLVKMNFRTREILWEAGTKPENRPPQRRVGRMSWYETEFQVVKK
jgi:hypothetical protein